MKNEIIIEILLIKRLKNRMNQQSAHTELFKLIIQVGSELEREVQHFTNIFDPQGAFPEFSEPKHRIALVKAHHIKRVDGFTLFKIHVNDQLVIHFSYRANQREPRHVKFGERSDVFIFQVNHVFGRDDILGDGQFRQLQVEKSGLDAKHHCVHDR